MFGKYSLVVMTLLNVSVGFGIVKPRLGPTLHRVVGVGGLYFVLSVTEAYLRVTKPKNDVSTGMMLAGVPLAVIDRCATIPLPPLINKSQQAVVVSIVATFFLLQQNLSKPKKG